MFFDCLQLRKRSIDQLTTFYIHCKNVYDFIITAGNANIYESGHIKIIIIITSVASKSLETKLKAHQHKHVDRSRGQ